MNITHIDGLSGAEEAGALKIVNADREESINEGICPNCNSTLLVEHYEADGPDDFTTELYCKDCGENLT